jgi:hypothetical protein
VSSGCRVAVLGRRYGERLAENGRRSYNAELISGPAPSGHAAPVADRARHPRLDPQAQSPASSPGYLSDLPPIDTDVANAGFKLLESPLQRRRSHRGMNRKRTRTWPPPPADTLTATSTTRAVILSRARWARSRCRLRPNQPAAGDAALYRNGLPAGHPPRRAEVALVDHVGGQAHQAEVDHRAPRGPRRRQRPRRQRRPLCVGRSRGHGNESSQPP